MRKIVAIVALLALAGCSDPAPETSVSKTQTGDGSLSVEVIEVNGRQISCVVFDGYNAGGVSCDFTREATIRR